MGFAQKAREERAFFALPDPTYRALLKTSPAASGDLKRGTLRAIIAQAGLTLAEFLDLL